MAQEWRRAEEFFRPFSKMPLGLPSEESLPFPPPNFALLGGEQINSRTEDEKCYEYDTRPTPHSAFLPRRREAKAGRIPNYALPPARANRRAQLDTGGPGDRPDPHHPA